MSDHHLTVDLGERSYPIFIGEHLLTNQDYLTPYITGKQVMIVTNTTVAPLYLDTVKKMLPAYQVAEVILPDGEQYKNLEVLNQIYTALLTAQFDRQCTLIALGGGVVGDMTGFAASSYQRGVNFIQIPTTLLSQVDSSVGGKTGVNHSLGKNMIGAFYQPQCVIADTMTLNTLDNRQLSAGLAEVIKYGLINDLEFFQWLEQNINALLNRDSSALAYAIRRSCQDKADVVAQDERESGIRALLNLGHTFGHAIETGMGYGEWLHGEAVGAGMCLAAQLSQQLGLMNIHDVQRTVRLIKQARLPTQPPESMSAKQFTDLMAVDKKVINQQLRLILMKGIGQSFLTSDITVEQIEQCIKQN